jgi:hypothetical protein
VVRVHNPRDIVPSPGRISGHVFLITRAGDVKPARMAKVFGLFLGGHEEDQSAGNNSASHSFAKQLLEALREMSGKPAARSEQLVCLRELMTYSTAMLETMKWADAEQKRDQIIQTDTDEDGNFDLAGPPGIYTLIVKGRAGLNDAVWTRDVVKIVPGETTLLKLASPEPACLTV